MNPKDPRPPREVNNAIITSTIPNVQKKHSLCTLDICELIILWFVYNMVCKSKVTRCRPHTTTLHWVGMGAILLFMGGHGWA